MYSIEAINTYTFLRYQQQQRRGDAITDTAIYYGINRESLEVFIQQYAI
jgi:hypothetical protein